MALGILLILAGVTSFVVFLVSSLTRYFKALERVDVPGARELVLEAGNYTVYWETDSRFGSIASRSDLDLSVAPQGGGAGLAVAASGLMSGRYSTMDRFGSSIGSFTVEQDGPYTVSVAALAGRTLPRGRLSLGPSLGFLGTVRIVLVCLALMGAGVGGGVTLLVRKGSRPSSRGS
jgi:hypothetical protein